jgi:2-oxoglutarate ferredoxin oxidoreductase subunit gamma
VPRREILISGFGGQGVVLAGRILGYAAVLAGQKATMLVSHGTETRGGYVRSQVVVASQDIDSPLVEKPDFFAALSQAAYQRFIPLVTAGLTLYDPALVTPGEPITSRHQPVPARELAEAKTGSVLAANMVFLGVILAGLPTISREAGKQAVREIVRRQVEKNILALEAGYALAESRVVSG